MGLIENIRKNLLDRKSQDKAKDVNSLFKALLDQTRSERLVWLVCSAYARGIQHSVIDEDTQQLLTPKPSKGIRRSKINKIGSWKKHMMARIVAVRPEFEVLPRDMSQEQINMAQAGTAYLRHNVSAKRWQIKRYQVANYCLDFGNCFGYVKDHVDKSRLYAVRVYMPDGETPMLDPDTGDEMFEQVPVEDVDQDILLPHSVLCDNTEGELSDKYDLILNFWRNLSYFPLTYGNKGKEVQPENIGASLANYDLSTLTQLGGVNTQLEGATELVYMRKPNDQDPKGKVIIVVGNEIMDEFDWAYKHLEDYNLVHFRWGPPAPGKFFSEPPIKDQIGLQDDMNETASIIQENIVNMGHKKWMVPIGSGINSINDLSGEIVEYVPNFMPTQSEVTSLPQYEVNHLSVLDSFMEDVQLLHSTSKGAGTPNVRSKIGLDKLEEEDLTPMAIPDDFISDGYQQLGKKTLQIAAEKLDTPRLVRYIGEGRRKIIEDFTKEMIDGRSEVTVRLVDTHMRHKGTSQRLILEMFHNGMIVDNFGQRDPAKAQKMLEFALPPLMYEKEDQQRDVAYDENDLLIKGQQIPAEEWEYHFIHIDIVEELLNGMEWKELRKKGEKLAEVAMQHRMAHLELLKKSIQQQMGQQGQQGQQQQRTQQGGQPQSPA